MGCVIHNIWDTHQKQSACLLSQNESSSFDDEGTKTPGRTGIRARKLGYRIYRGAAKTIPQMSFEPLKRKEFSTQCWFFDTIQKNLEKQHTVVIPITIRQDESRDSA